MFTEQQISVALHPTTQNRIQVTWRAGAIARESFRRAGRMGGDYAKPAAGSTGSGDDAGVQWSGIGPGR
jgi:hypothetical protein